MFRHEDYMYHGEDDLFIHLDHLKQYVQNAVIDQFRKTGPFKFYICIYANFYGKKDDEFEHKIRYFPQYLSNTANSIYNTKI